MSTAKITCTNCLATLKSQANFCHLCGEPFVAPVFQGKQKRAMWHSILYYGLTALVLVGFSLDPYTTFIDYFTIVEILLIALTTTFFLLNFRETRKAFNWSPKVRKSWWLPLVFFIPIVLPVFYGMDWLNVHWFYSLSESYYDMFSEYPYALLITFLFIAVSPAIFEELAYRGFLYDHATTLFGERSAIVVTGVLFALGHFSLASLIWLIPFGLYLGWLRYYTKSIWPSVLAHFLHNSSILLLEQSQNHWVGFALL